MLYLVGQFDGGDPLRVLGLPRHLRELAAAGRTRALIRRQLVAYLHDRQGRLRSRPMTWSRGSRRRRRRWRVGRRRQQLCATLFQRPQLRERQLLGIRHATQPGELRGQLQRLGDEPLIFALEEETDLS